MQANLTVTDGRAVVKLQGRFDFNAHRDFRDAVDKALATTAREIHIDMSAVDYLDSSALGMLLMLRDKAKSATRDVALTNCSGAVKQVLEIANFSKLFRVI
jgi:anti-anti-sigma factor